MTWYWLIMFDHPEDGRIINKSGFVHELSTPTIVIFLFKLGIVGCTTMDTTWHNRVAGYGTQASQSTPWRDAEWNCSLLKWSFLSGWWALTWGYYWDRMGMTSAKWWLKGYPISSSLSSGGAVQQRPAVRRNWGRHRGHKNQQTMRTKDAALEVSSCEIAIRNRDVMDLTKKLGSRINVLHDHERNPRSTIENPDIFHSWLHQSWLSQVVTS